MALWIMLQLIACGFPLLFSFHTYMLSSVCDLFSVHLKLFLCAANLAVKGVGVGPIYIFVAVWEVTFCLIDDVLDSAFSWQGAVLLVLQVHLISSVLDSLLMILVLWAGTMADVLFMQL